MELYQKEVDLIQHALDAGVTPGQVEAIFGREKALPYTRCAGTEICNPTGHGSFEHCHDCGKQL